MATITRRSDSGKWEAKIRSKGRRESKCFDRRIDAIKWVADREGKPVKKAVGLFSDVLNIYRGKLTSQTYVACFSPLLYHFGHLSLDKITAETISKYVENRIEIIRSTTLQKELLFLNQVFKFAIEILEMDVENVVAKNRRHWKYIFKKTEKDSRHYRITNNQFTKILDNLREDCKPYVQLLLMTGMRRSELYNCTVNLIEKTIVIHKTKNGERRLIPLSNMTVEFLKTVTLPPTVTADVITRGFMRACRMDESTKHLRLHDIRHEAISRLFERGDLSLIEIKLLSGHKTMSQLSRYSHADLERIKEKLK